MLYMLEMSHFGVVCMNPNIKVIGLEITKPIYTHPPTHLHTHSDTDTSIHNVFFVTLFVFIWMFVCVNVCVCDWGQINSFPYYYQTFDQLLEDCLFSAFQSFL